MTTITPEEAVSLNNRYVHGLALKLAPAPGLAEDIAQQVFLEFWKKKDTWDLTKDVRPLLAGMTRNVARRCWREKVRGMSPELREFAEHVRLLSEEDDEDPEWYDEQEKSVIQGQFKQLQNSL